MYICLCVCVSCLVYMFGLLLTSVCLYSTLSVIPIKPFAGDKSMCLSKGNSISQLLWLAPLADAYRLHVARGSSHYWSEIFLH